MAMSMHCSGCHEVLATSDILMLATVPPSQTHVAVRKDKEEVAFERMRKIPNPSPKKAAFSPFKILCKKCPSNVGGIRIVEEDMLICFKIENVYFRKGFEVIKDKRLKKIKDRLVACGLPIVNVSHLSKMLSQDDGAGRSEESAVPMVYCDTHALNPREMESWTRDTPRDYQQELSQYALQENSLIYLPTGSGKTLIAAMVISCMKKLNPKKLMVFLTDRIPLVYQQSDYIKSQVSSLRVEILAGDIGRFPGDKARWRAVEQALRENKVDLLVLTHQILLNLMDKESQVLDMRDISVLVFDEAHHCRGNHQYNKIMMDFYKHTPDKYKPLVLALTASPAGALSQEETQENLDELLSNLCARACMPVTSSDLRLHWNRPVTSYKVISLNSTQQQLHVILENYLVFLRPLIEQDTLCPGILQGTPVSSPHFRGALRKAIDRCYGDKSKVRGLALGEHAMHMLGAIEINNILGCEYALGSLQECLGQVQNAATPFERLKRKLVENSEQWTILRDSVKSLRDQTSLRYTPDSDRYQELVKEVNAFIRKVHSDDSSRGIVFVKMRKTAYKLCELLRQTPSVADVLNPAYFVGHGQGNDGMEWRGEQEEVLKRFRSGEIKLLISTSVLEEGLDVPVCNLVVRFDSAMTLRSLVQSRGRASRRPDSKFVVICTDSKEVVAANEAIRKEQNMETAMRNQTQRYQPQYRVLQASTFGCQTRKPDLSNPQIEESKDSEEQESPENNGLDAATVHERGESLNFESPRKKQKKYIPQMKVAILNVCRSDGSTDFQEVAEFFEEYFEVKSLESESQSSMETEGDTSCTINLMVEPLEAERFQNKETFFSHVIESWCSRGHGMQASTQSAQMWLQRTDSPRRQRKQEIPVYILKADALSIGNFVTRTSFRSRWPIATSALQNVRLAFEHDIRKMRVFFHVPNVLSRWKADLFKFEIHYSELEEFVLVDKRKSRSTSEMLFSLRRPPRMYRAKAFIQKDEDELNDFEDWYYDEDDYDGWDSDSDVLTSDSDSEDEKKDASKTSDLSEQEALLTSCDVTRLDAVVNWERVTEVIDSSGAVGRCLTYAFTLPEQSWPDAKKLFGSIGRFDKKVFYTHVSHSTDPVPGVSIARDLSFDVKYALKCLLSRYPVIEDRVTGRFGGLLTDKPENRALAALEKLGASLERDKFCDPESSLESLLSQVTLRQSGRRPLLPDHCAFIKRLVITPTRVLFYTPEIMSRNRVLRNYDTKNFLCVNIRDEDFNKLSAAGGTIDKLLERVKKILDEGVEPGGQRFLYLGSSNSQLRNHSCWFVAPSPHPNEIRQWMGDFSKIR